MVVTVDMIATGTDVKPIEVLIFMRDVKSELYFEQMKGRGVRSIDRDTLLDVTPNARTGKERFIIVDAGGVGDYIEQITYLLFLKMDEEREELLGEAFASGSPCQVPWLAADHRPPHQHQKDRRGPRG